jgi:predicted nuclease with TOPRIM domain
MPPKRRRKRRPAQTDDELQADYSKLQDEYGEIQAQLEKLQTENKKRRVENTRLLERLEALQQLYEDEKEIRLLQLEGLCESHELLNEAHLIIENLQTEPGHHTFIGFRRASNRLDALRNFISQCKQTTSQDHKMRTGLRRVTTKTT